VINNPALKYLNGLDNLYFFKGDLCVWNNPDLRHILSIDGITNSQISEIVIRDNCLLSTCEVCCICKCLCEKDTKACIYNNAKGCSSDEEILYLCGESTRMSVNEETMLTGCLVYPNPSSNIATFEFELNESAPVSLIIYNHLGQEVDVVMKDIEVDGKYLITWKHKGLTPGVYYYKLSKGNQCITDRLILMN
jgi:hypothetical protein